MNNELAPQGLQTDLSLKTHNTLGIDAKARYGLVIEAEDQIPPAIDFADQQQLPIMILGEGSNIVLSQDFPGLVLMMQLKGVRQVEEGDHILVSAAAGENWHQLAMGCLAKQWFGLENMVLIPGSVGAAPIQNIGAYGVELSSVFHSLRGWDRETGEWQELYAADCNFAYRDSVFKQHLKDRFIITRVSLKLSKTASVNTRYGALAAQLEQQGITTPTPLQVAEQVIAVRNSKLPDPLHLPNAGSFFKNPIVSQQQFKTLQGRFPQIPHYPQDDGRVKLAAGWLVEQAGWKGKRHGAVGMHTLQALVLVNYDGGSGASVIALAQAIQQDIARQFAVQLNIEPSIY